MEDLPQPPQANAYTTSPSSSSLNNNRRPETGEDDSRNNSEPAVVRSRWNPKPEQILILESIFNSGMVNPPREETIKIRKLLEKFGSVGDANVFYWFQNRRSRSRRRQRQLLAEQGHASGGAADYTGTGGCATTSGNYVLQSPPSSSTSFFEPNRPMGSSSSPFHGGIDDEMLGFPSGETMTSIQYDPAAGIEQSYSVSPSVMCPSFSPPHDASHMPYQPAVTVFINGVATEVPRGPINMRAMFGEDEFVLYHSSGIPLPINEFGILLQSLRHGETYFLVIASLLKL
ncbi:unnamed protein product [Cuscuta epithymum]|uniref:Protein WUSCHEL n=1 Tax=Cuscuta epithymum TaxID=186058 RepID=A0AAV0D351_9ASTE|nr:unnamed protein product [Cuscuta epithymum]